MNSSLLLSLALLLAMTPYLNADSVSSQALDSQGGDMGPPQTAQMQANCSSLDTCPGSNTHDRTLVDALPPASEWTHWTYERLEGFSTDTNDYIFIQGADSQGGDITCIANQTLAQLKAYCDKTDGCVGFNTKGQVKSYIVPQEQWTHWSDNVSDGLWIKASEMTRIQSIAGAQNGSSCNITEGTPTPNNTNNTDTDTQLSGYVYHQGFESQSGYLNIMAGPSLRELKDACDADVRCVSFNTNGDLFGGRVLHEAFWTPLDGGFYAKENPVILQNPTLDQFVTYPSVSSVGIMYKQVDGGFDQISQACIDDSECIAFTTGGQLYNFLIQQSEWQYSDDTTYLRMNPPPFDLNTTTPTYTYYDGLDSESADIGYYPGLSIDQVKVLCDSDDRCVSFNTDGYLKGGRVLERSFWKSWSGGFYVKDNPRDDYPVFNYVRYRNVTPAGAVFTKASGDLNEIEDQCNVYPPCLAFTPDGTLYSVLLPEPYWESSEETTYLKMNPSRDYLPPPETYAYYDGFDSESGDLLYAGFSVEALKLLCDADARCVSFNTDGYLRAGKVLDRANWVSHSGGFYIKLYPRILSSNSLEDYLSYENSVPNGPSYNQITGSVDDFYNACESDDACVAFTTSGDLYDSLTPTSQWIYSTETTYIRMNPPYPYDSPLQTQQLIQTQSSLRVQQVPQHVLSA